VVETGRRRRWSEDEKLRIVGESLSGQKWSRLSEQVFRVDKWSVHRG
jgi:transposase-like protein